MLLTKTACDFSGFTVGRWLEYPANRAGSSRHTLAWGAPTDLRKEQFQRASRQPAVVVAVRLRSGRTRDESGRRSRRACAQGAEPGSEWQQRSGGPARSADPTGWRCAAGRQPRAGRFSGSPGGPRQSVRKRQCCGRKQHRQPSRRRAADRQSGRDHRRPGDVRRSGRSGTTICARG